MASNQMCPGLVNISFVDSGDLKPLTIAVINGCYLVNVNYLNLIIEALHKPFTLKYCNSYGECYKMFMFN